MAHPGFGQEPDHGLYAGRIIREPALQNPTIVLLTDRNDLDDQLFGTFSRCQELLRQPPVQAGSRADLRAKLAVESGGVVFTTIQKFFPEEKGDRHPELSKRRNIVVIADEAHRSQYEFIDGFARHMRDALPMLHSSVLPARRSSSRTPTRARCSAITSASMTSSVLSRTRQPCRSTTRARLAKLALDEGARPKIDPDFEEITEGGKSSERRS